MNDVAEATQREVDLLGLLEGLTDGARLSYLFAASKIHQVQPSKLLALIWQQLPHIQDE